MKTESGAGVLLAVAAAAGLGLANSHWAGAYFALISWPAAVRVGDFAETLPLSGWVSQALMPVFFLVIGMQLKFEVLRGELSSPRRLAMPLIAATGGVVVPALVYLAINRASGAAADAWPTVAGVDIALALGVLAAAAPRMPASLRVFLLTIAIVDDLAGVGLKALLFAGPIDRRASVGAIIGLAALAAVSRWRRAPFLLYAVGFVSVWAFTLKSGIDPALAGVTCAMTAPIGTRRPGQDSALKYFIDSLHPYVAYLILPLYAFTVMGVSVRGIDLGQLAQSAGIGVLVALLAGKPLGVLGFSWLAVATRVARRPTGATWADLAGISGLCGVGLSASLYLASAGVHADQAIAATPLAIFAASMAAAVGGGFILRRARSETSDASP